jgi:hypothetical protein
MTPCKVSFFKNLLSSNGHQFKCLQGVINIRRAKSMDRAVQAAERRFARRRSVPHWTLHADDIELEIDGKKVAYRPSPAEATCAWYPAFTHGIHH